jgi:hypothetical protein
MSETKKQSEVSIAAMAIAGVRFLTPLLVALLVYIASQANLTLDRLVETVQQIQITMAKEQAVNQAERDNTNRILVDHEHRLRKIEENQIKGR